MKKCFVLMPALISMIIISAFSASVFAEENQFFLQRSIEKLDPRLKLYGHADFGYTYNPDKPDLNFGRLFDDGTDDALLNQLILTLERPLDPLEEGFDWGFKLQGLYGSDARFTHTLGLLDNISNDTYELDIVEAFLNTHFPILTERGVDMKVGQFVTMEGAEVIDAPGNFFYSHSYIFNFGIPLKHAGVMATTHLTNVDIYTGLTRGVNTSLDDNNDALAFHGGVGITLLDGKVFVMASTHVGPETPGNDSDYRYLNDITMIIKLTDKLTSTTDLNYALDDFADADAYGIAQYLTYAVNDWLSVGLRGEVFRDDEGFFVAQIGDNDDLINLQRGEVLDSQTVGGGRTTYGALTFGLNIKPAKYVLIRPEIRYDHVLDNGSSPFNDGAERGQLTAGVGATYFF